FRTSDAAEALRATGIKLISSQFANTNIDAPALPPETKSVVDDRSVHAVVDLGGDDRGALALGRYSKRIREEANYEMLLVINQYRPLTRSLADLSQIRGEIEAAGKVPFTGVVNNSNLGAETTLADILASQPFAEEAACNLGLPLRMTAVSSALLPGEEQTAGWLERRFEGPVFPVNIAFNRPGAYK
ncbi:MAG: ParA family protein, partial [Clostridia bacterium]|nr:ParA family protein [Clostridia bacterium]